MYTVIGIIYQWNGKSVRLLLYMHLGEVFMHDISMSSDLFLSLYQLMVFLLLTVYYNMYTNIIQGSDRMAQLQRKINPGLTMLKCPPLHLNIVVSLYFSILLLLHCSGV